MICIHGEQLTPPGQSGIYFICQDGQYKGNHCRWVKWCTDSRSYIAKTDKYGNACPNFATEESAEQQENIDERIQEILSNPGDCSKKKEIEQTVIEEPTIEIIVKPIENIEESADADVEEIIEKSVEDDIKKNVQENVEEIVKENVEEIVSEIADEIFNNFIKQSESKGENKIKIKFIIGDEIKENINQPIMEKQPIIKTIEKDHDIFKKTPIIKTIGKN